LWLVDRLQEFFFTDLPHDAGLNPAPVWWPLPLLVVSGILTALAIRRLPGDSGHSPADGFKAGGRMSPNEVPGIALAALATLSLGVVLGPEAPLIAIGGGLAVAAFRPSRRHPDQRTRAVVAS